MVPNLGGLLKRVDQLLPAVQETLDRVDRAVASLDERVAQLDRIPAIERELAALRAAHEAKHG